MSQPIDLIQDPAVYAVNLHIDHQVQGKQIKHLHIIYLCVYEISIFKGYLKLHYFFFFVLFSMSFRQPSRSPSQGSLPSLNGIMQIAGMEQYASLRHPDGASDPNLPKLEKPFVLEHEDICEVDEKSALLSPSKRSSLENEEEHDDVTRLVQLNNSLPITNQSQLPLLPLNTSSEAYDSGHDSSTPRTSKHSGISRRAESGYHSVATARDSDESSFTSGLSKEHHNRITVKKKRQDKGLCTWLINPFTCTYPETEGEISDF